jgi:hypothetical protein
MFPAGLNHGVFIGFHGLFNEGGITNDENPMLFADPSTGHYFDFISNDLPNIGHLDEAMSTEDSLFVADITSGGDMGTGAGQGMIYQIKAINHPPVLSPIPQQTVNEGSLLTVDASATDLDADQTLTFTLGAGAPSGASIDPKTGVFSWTPDPYAGAGTYSITIAVTDNGSPPLSDSQAFTVDVLPVNHPPVLSPIPTQKVNEGSPVTFTAQATDPDIPAQTISYSLGSGAPTGASIDAQSGVFTWTPDAYAGAGTYSITVIATDDGSPPQSDSRAVTVDVLPVNHPPVLTAVPDQTVKEGSLVTFTAQATDPDVPAQTITYTLGPGAPAGAAINAQSGVFTWTPDPYASTGDDPITIVATDNGSPPLSDSQSLVVHVLAVNHPPVFSTIPTQIAELGGTFQLDVGNFVSDPDRPAQTLHFAFASAVPDGASLDAASGVFTWAVPPGQALGALAISIQVTDNGSPPLSQSGTFVVRVVPLNHPPVLAPIPSQTVDEGNPVTVTARATDSDVPAQTITYSVGPGASPGAAINPQTGVFSWTPDPYSSSGTYSITIVATDDGPVPKSDSQILEVDVLPVNHPPVFSAIPAQTAAPGQTFQLGMAGFVSDPDRPAQVLHYALAPNAPTGSSIDPASGIVTWVLPSSQHIGTYSFGVIVTDSGSPQLSQAASFTVNVVDNGPVATISQAKVRARHGLIITLTFSQPLDSSTATDPDNYILVAPARHKRKRWKNPLSTRIPLTVSYDPASSSVTLKAQGRVSLQRALHLTVIGTGPDGVAKITGLPLAGSGFEPGTNYVASISAKGIHRTMAVASRTIGVVASVAGPLHLTVPIPTGPLALARRGVLDR